MSHSFKPHSWWTSHCGLHPQASIKVKSSKGGPEKEKPKGPASLHHPSLGRLYRTTGQIKSYLTYISEEGKKKLLVNYEGPGHED